MKCGNEVDFVSFSPFGQEKGFYLEFDGNNAEDIQNVFGSLKIKEIASTIEFFPEKSFKVFTYDNCSFVIREGDRVGLDEQGNIFLLPTCSNKSFSRRIFMSPPQKPLAKFEVVIESLITESEDEDKVVTGRYLITINVSGLSIPQLASAVLDEFHAQVPIAQLEDFKIHVEDRFGNTLPEDSEATPLQFSRFESIERMKGEMLCCPQN